MNLARRITSTIAAVAACAGVVTVAHATENPTGQAVSVADEQPPYAIEDFGYPGADKIQDELGIILKRGDGHITLADCVSEEGLLEVYSRTNGTICFRTTGKSGYLSLEIPSVYGVRGDSSYQADVTLTADDDQQTITVDPNEWKGVGESADPQGRIHTLVEISTSE